MIKQKQPKFITIINDSKDDNAKARQETRWASLFPSIHISFIGINSELDKKATIQAAGNLIDGLDAGEGRSGIIAVNVAPRGEKEEDGENGSPFAYFWYKKTLVISTIKDYNLSLVKKLRLIKYVNLLDTVKVLKFALKNEQITKQQYDHITKTQFRSFDFQPRVSKWLFDNLKIPSKKVDISNIPDIPDSVWHIDSFGNYKTTLLQTEILNSHSGAKWNEEIESIKTLRTNLGELPFYDRLKDVPTGKTVIYTGSSGINNKRFLEIARQNTPGSAHKEFGEEIGSEIKVV